jgi:D-proline reductase (dithiol) PrdB
MARLEDLPEPTRTVAATAPCPKFDTAPFVAGPPLRERRVAIISSAALIRRGEAPFAFGSVERRALPADLPAGEILTSHPSIAHDRSGFQRDINVVYPVDRLRELAAEGVIAGAAATHYTIMGSSDATAMGEAADQIAGQLRQERIDSVLLSPV